MHEVSADIKEFPKSLDALVTCLYVKVRPIMLCCYNVMEKLREGSPGTVETL
ncbi:14690_t:CDS:2, partial [Funneliformis geosporum]